MALQRIRGSDRHPPLRERIKDMEGWCIDKALAESRIADYRRLLTTEDYLSELEREQPREPSRP
jgi:hypothetical protein